MAVRRHLVPLLLVISLIAGFTIGSVSVASAGRVRLLTPAQEGTVSILAGTGSSGTPTPGPAVSSALAGVNGLVVDASGNVYIADGENNKVFKITSGGILSVFAGTGAVSNYWEEPPAITPGPATSANLAAPSGLAVDSSGNLYVAVSGSRQIVKITPGGTLEIVAGTGQWFDPFGDPPTSPVLVPGPATSVDLNNPVGVAVDASGNLFILDDGYHQALKVTTGGTLSVIAGTGVQGDPTPGPATSSRLVCPTEIAVDPSGNLYIPDSCARKVLKVTTDGTLSIFAGTGVEGLPSPGPATSSPFDGPENITVDSAGNVFVNDWSSKVVVKITPAGTLTVVAGTGYQGRPTAGPVADSDLSYPYRVAVDTVGDIYILDYTYRLLEKVTFTRPVVAPAAPTSLTATPGDGSALISFTAGADGGASISKYQYQLGSGSWVDAVGTSSPITISGLSNGTAYTVKLRAVNSAGSGAASVASSSFTPRTVPGAPSITSVNPGDSTVSVEFTAGSTGGSLITGYEYQLNGSGSWFSLGTTSSPASIGVTNGVAYTVKLRALNVAGSGAASVTSSSFTPATTPSAPTSLVATKGDGSASIAFTAGSDGGAAITNYKYSTDNGSSWNAFSPAVTTPSVTIGGLTNGTTYSVKLRAVNSAGDGAASDAVSVTPRTVPAAPTSLVATPGDGSVSVAFTAGADGGASITKYQFSIDDGSTWADAVAGTTSPVSITGLTNFTTYNVKLRAVNSAGDGAASSSVSVTPAIAGPISCSAIALPPRRIQTCWNPFTPSEGSLIRVRTELYLAGTNTVVRACVSKQVGQTSCVFIGLERNTTYDVRVRARIRIAPRKEFFTLATTQQVTTLP